MHTFFKKIHFGAFITAVVIVVLCFFTQTQAAILSVKTLSSTTQGERIAVDVLVDPQGKTVNSIEATIVFPKDLVAFNGFSSHQSGISLWVVQPKETTPGSVHFSGVIPGGLDRLYDPLNTDNTAIPLVRLFFVAKQSGSAVLSIKDGLVLENNGKGTSLPVTTTSSTVNILATGNKEVDVVNTSKDTTEPKPFTVTLVERSVFGKTPRLAVFFADDTEGGIEHYEVAVGGGRFQIATSPFPLPYRLFSYNITVRAFDFAGNVREQQITVPGEKQYGLGVAIALLLIMIVLYRIMKKIKKKNAVTLGVYSIALFFLLQVQAFASGGFVLSPSQREIPVGKTFSVHVLAQSPTQAMNAVSGTIMISGGAFVSSVSTQGGIVDFWTSEPKISGNQIHFEGVVLNPGYQGPGGRLFTINFTARKEGIATIAVTDGAVLANDGLGSNIIDKLSSLTLKLIPAPNIALPPLPPVAVAPPVVETPTKIVALPVITEFSATVGDKGAAFLKGKGEPNALTKLSFKDVSLKSLGEQFIIALQSKKKKPTEALVKNDAEGIFQYVSPDNLVAGVYNVTPFLVDEENQTQKPGFGVHILVNNSKMVHWLVVLINILALLIPVACLAVIIYFIPWYSRLRMKILKHKIAVEDEQLTLSEKVIKEKELHVAEVKIEQPPVVQ